MKGWLSSECSEEDRVVVCPNWVCKDKRVKTDELRRDAIE